MRYNGYWLPQAGTSPLGHVEASRRTHHHEGGPNPEEKGRDDLPRAAIHHQPRSPRSHTLAARGGRHDHSCIYPGDRGGGSEEIPAPQSHTSAARVVTLPTPGQARRPGGGAQRRLRWAPTPQSPPDIEEKGKASRRASAERVNNDGSQGHYVNSVNESGISDSGHVGVSGSSHI
jgi:hypothetical protein